MDVQEFYQKAAEERLVTADLFDFETIVVPVKTRGRTYGTISRQCKENTALEIPALSLGGTQFVARSVKPNVIFVAFWGDTDNFDSPALAHHIYACTRACVQTAGREKQKLVALPLLGGKHGPNLMWVMEHGVHDAESFLEAIGYTLPDVTFVTDHTLA